MAQEMFASKRACVLLVPGMEAPHAAPHVAAGGADSGGAAGGASPAPAPPPAPGRRLHRVLRCRRMRAARLRAGRRGQFSARQPAIVPTMRAHPHRSPDRGRHRQRVRTPRPVRHPPITGGCHHPLPRAAEGGADRVAHAFLPGARTFLARAQPHRPAWVAAAFAPHAEPLPAPLPAHMQWTPLANLPRQRPRRTRASRATRLSGTLRPSTPQWDEHPRHRDQSRPRAAVPGLWAQRRQAARARGDTILAVMRALFPALHGEWVPAVVPDLPEADVPPTIRDGTAPHAPAAAHLVFPSTTSRYAFARFDVLVIHPAALPFLVFTFVRTAPSVLFYTTTS